MIKNLKALRTKKGISQQKLANIISVSQQSINKYENHGVEPGIETLIALARFFNTSVDYLIGFSSIDHVLENIFPYELNEQEMKLIDGYRRLSERERESIQFIVRTYLSEET